MLESEIRQRIDQYSRFPQRGKINIVTDTSEFMTIKAGDVLELDGSFFLVRGEEIEGRFGLDGEPKFWVKKAVDLADGAQKIIKLVFYESFVMQLGAQQIKCFRSPRKEARILDKTSRDPYFMKGYNVLDKAGNIVRIIDRVVGARYYDFINGFNENHEDYFFSHFPAIFENVILCVEALDRLHRMEELHGDVRNDHLIVDRETGIYTWIDFDYTYEWAENRFGVDLFGLGNILLFTLGKGFHTLPDLAARGPEGMRTLSCLVPEDLSLFFKNRIINLQKLFPHIPDSLTQVLMHFSLGADVFYETTEELLEDLRACLPVSVR